MSSKTTTTKQESPLTKGMSNLTKAYEHRTNHGFHEFRSLKAMNDYYASDPEGDLDMNFEPPAFGKSKPSEKDRAVSRGEL